MGALVCLEGSEVRRGAGGKGKGEGGRKGGLEDFGGGCTGQMTT